ncbi:MAG: hypothetical protein ACTSVM_01270 [Candidatus Ranarchaeia archaeon]
MDDDVIRYKVFPVLTFLIIVMTVSSYTVSKILAGSFGVTAQSIAAQILSNPVGLLIITILYFAFFFLALITVRIRIINIITATLFSLVNGGRTIWKRLFFRRLDQRPDSTRGVNLDIRRVYYCGPVSMDNP